MISWLQEATSAGVEDAVQGMSVVEWAQIATALATALSAIATTILAIYAFVAARTNRVMVQEMRESRLSQERPYIVVDLD